MLSPSSDAHGRSPEGAEPALRSRFRGALLGTLVGDALGAPYEGRGVAFERLAAAQVASAAAADDTPAVERARAGLAAHLARSGSLHYTDDTQMMIALAEAIVERGDVDPDHIAARFAARFERSRGYGAGTVQVLERIADGEGWERAARGAFPEGSYGNGAAMRVAPIGALFYDQPDRLHRSAELSAAVTHAHPDGIGGAVVQAHCVGLALAAGLRAEPLRLDYFLRALAGRVMSYGSGYSLLEPVARACAAIGRGEPLTGIRREVGTGIRAVEAVPAAVGVFLAAGGEVEGSIALALMLGGDTDTIAAMAGALAGAYQGEERLPRAALAALADERDGVELIATLADRLLALRR